MVGGLGAWPPKTQSEWQNVKISAGCDPLLLLTTFAKEQAVVVVVGDKELVTNFLTLLPSDLITVTPRSFPSLTVFHFLRYTSASPFPLSPRIYSRPLNFTAPATVNKGRLVDDNFCFYSDTWVAWAEQVAGLVVDDVPHHCHCSDGGGRSERCRQHCRY